MCLLPFVPFTSKIFSTVLWWQLFKIIAGTLKHIHRKDLCMSNCWAVIDGQSHLQNVLDQKMECIVKISHKILLQWIGVSGSANSSQLYIVLPTKVFRNWITNSIYLLKGCFEPTILKSSVQNYEYMHASVSRLKNRIPCLRNGQCPTRHSN